MSTNRPGGDYPPRKIQQLTRMVEFSCSLTGEVDLEALLQRVVDAAVELTKAERGGMLVLDEKGEYAYFKTSGCSEDPGEFPTGRGILSIPYRENRALWEPDIRTHPQAAGTPQGHPEVVAFIAVPLQVRGKALGSLFVGNGPGKPVFSESDKDLLTAFAAQAAVAIENTRLYQRSEQLAVLEERQRIAQSLHETVVQYLFAIGLEAERSLAQSHDCEKQFVTIQRLAERATDELRGAIFSLSASMSVNPKGLGAILRDLVAEFEATSGVQASLLLPSPIPQVSLAVNEAIYRIAREALSNVKKHARATAVAIALSVQDNTIDIAIQDNGQGLSSTQREGLHFGLLTMKQVAENAKGEVSILNSEDDVGTVVRATFPCSEGGEP